MRRRPADVLRPASVLLLALLPVLLLLPGGCAEPIRHPGEAVPLRVNPFGQISLGQFLDYEAALRQALEAEPGGLPLPEDSEALSPLQRATLQAAQARQLLRIVSVVGEAGVLQPEERQLLDAVEGKVLDWYRSERLPGA